MTSAFFALVSTPDQELRNDENYRMTARSPENFLPCGEFSTKSILYMKIEGRHQAHVSTLHTLSFTGVGRVSAIIQI